MSGSVVKGASAAKARVGVPLPSGFRNSGNSCFLNAVLQSLASVRGMHTYLARVRQDAPPDTGEKLLASKLQSTLRQVAPPETRTGARTGGLQPDVASHPALVRMFLASHRQHDAHELMQFLLDGVDAEAGATYGGSTSSLSSLVSQQRLGEESSRRRRSGSAGSRLLEAPATTTWSFLSDEETDPVDAPEVLAATDNDSSLSKPRDPFLGTVQGTLVFASCNHKGEPVINPFRDLSLPIPSAEERRKYQLTDTIEDYMRYYTVSEVVEDVRCERCDESARRMLGLGDPRVANPASFARIRSSRTAKKQLSIARAPEALCLHIQRLVSNGLHAFKHSHHVRFALELDLRPFCGPQTQQSIRTQRNRRRKQREKLNASFVSGGARFSSLAFQGIGTGLASSDPYGSGWTTGASDSEPDFASGASREADDLEMLAYHLVSVVVHHGSAAGGHYTAYRRLREDSATIGPARAGIDIVSESDGFASTPMRLSDMWVHISDEQVRKVSVREVLKAEAYMLFYEAAAPAL